VKDGLGSHIIGPSTTNPRATARECYERVLQDAGLQDDDVAYIVGTGYGRAKVSFAHENISELSAHGRGAKTLLPSARTVIDIGGQDTKVVLLDAGGQMLEYVMNDKCAAGTGRFLDFIARTLGIDIEDLEKLHASGDYEPVRLSSMCSVFIESEVINLVNDEVPLPLIVQGLHQSIANRVAALVKRVGLVEDVVITGGVAKNAGVVDALQRNLRVALKTFPDGVDPQMMGGIGAAVIAGEKYIKQNG
jgi:predicted CoA-substrate-specific enzyme activase